MSFVLTFGLSLQDAQWTVTKGSKLLHVFVAMDKSRRLRWPFKSTRLSFLGNAGPMSMQTKSANNILQCVSPIYILLHDATPEIVWVSLCCGDNHLMLPAYSSQRVGQTQCHVYCECKASAA